ncbi:hypothetical protein METH_23055 (plasmid) [Leisingera methylohalidivorans DSM 14336]|uniref:Uncharacterized protein n=1 Tax=Leisingera methylohalidivorans DSM 14336 TaxID=999552 RepID=V9W0Q1_9RHOB|nr:hypothetical protein METH_23055 [Leisingera methylohalidivorans DSM 14336]
MVKDPASNACAIADSLMDLHFAAGRISYEHADEIIAVAESDLPPAGPSLMTRVCGGLLWSPTLDHRKLEFSGCVTMTGW